MKVFALGILLVSLYCIEGAVVRREAEGEEQAPVAPPADPSNFSQYFQTIADYFKKGTNEYAAQTRAMLQQLHESLVSEQVTERIRQALSTMVESAKAAMQ